MADLRYLQNQASACRQAAQASPDRRESDDLHHLASLYDRQVQQLISRQGAKQVQA